LRVPSFVSRIGAASPIQREKGGHLMSGHIKARGLKRIRVEPVANNPLARVLILENVDGKSSGYIINPDALEAILEPVLELASRWAGETYPQPRNTQAKVRERIVLPGASLQLTEGRDEKECAVRLFLGKMEIVFLIPLEQVMAGFHDLAKQFGMDDPDEAVN
jgi:hypothetical protein